MAVIPAPVVVQPSGGFYGDAGSWSAFSMRVGNPAVDVQVLISTFIRESWVISTQGCGFNDPSNCNVMRGGLFNVNASTTWQDQHGYTLGSESNLGYTVNQDIGDYGYDTLGISSPGMGGFTVNGSVVAAIFTTDFYLGYLGISPRDIDLPNAPVKPSFVGSLKNDNMIPSLSYGYTAGAAYMNATASLTLGGYDASRFTPNDVSFTFEPNAHFDLVVGIQSITFSDSASPTVSLLSTGSGILALIDSTVPDLWLPAVVCTAFEKAFGISLDPIHSLYLVNETQHEQLLKQNASVTFQLGNSIAGGSTVDIVLPYESFDLIIGSPLVSNTTRYFPLRQATASTQYTLGRTFLQASFLIADYERNNFSVSQCVFPAPETPHIVAIKSINDTTTTGTGTGTSTINPTIGTVTPTSSISPSSTAGVTITHTSHSLPTSAIAGIAIAIIALAIIIAGVVGYKVYRNRKPIKDIRHELPGLEGETNLDNGDMRHHPAYVFSKPKMGTVSREITSELADNQIRKSQRPGASVIQVPHGAVELSLDGALNGARSEMESPEPIPGRITSYFVDLPSPDPSFPDSHPSPPEPEDHRLSRETNSPNLASQSRFPLSSPDSSAFQSPIIGSHTRFDSQSSDGMSLGAVPNVPYFHDPQTLDPPSPGPSPTPQSSLIRR